MKKYMLKRWYPDIPSYMDNGFIIDYYKEEEKAIYTYPSGCRLGFSLPTHHLECSDFWELIEDNKPKPLFITEDGVDKFYSNQPLWEVNKDFKKLVSRVAWVASKGSKYFAHEENADKYIEENKPKPLFVTNDNVNIYHPKENVFLVNEFFEKDEGWYNESIGGKVFFHESNADEYIAWYKKEFSINDLLLADVGITTSQLDKLQELAKKG